MQQGLKKWFNDQAGLMCFLSPRSFTSGKYFRDHFVQELLRELKSSCKIHLFDGRRKNFGEQKVLQESIVTLLLGKNSARKPGYGNILIREQRSYASLI